MKLFLFLIALLSLPTLMAQDDLPPLVEEQEFQPHMIDHEHLGCPPNAHCNKDYGARRNAWTEQVKNLRQASQEEVTQKLGVLLTQVGMPVSVWATPQSLQLKEVASWNSPCRHHNLETGEIFLGEVFIRHLNEIPGDQEAIIANRTWIEGSDPPQAYLTFQGALPSAIKKNRLYYTREENGVYYGVLVSNSGELQITKQLSPTQPPREVHCPQSLLNAWKSWDAAQKIYQRPYCRAIWDEDQKTFKTLIVGWAC